MGKRILIILAFLICFANTSLAEANCKYFSQADVVNGELINKKEHYTCKEEKKDNVLVQFLTDPKYENAFIMVIATLLENI